MSVRVGAAASRPWTQTLSIVIAGLDPAIHDVPQQRKVVTLAQLRHLMDARVKRADDAEGWR
jgi:hypothetical protein